MVSYLRPSDICSRLPRESHKTEKLASYVLMLVGTDLNLHSYDFKDTNVPEQESLVPNPQGRGFTQTCKVGTHPTGHQQRPFRMIEGASLRPDGLGPVVPRVRQLVATWSMLWARVFRVRCLTSVTTMKHEHERVKAKAHLLRKNFKKWESPQRESQGRTMIRN